MTETQNYIFDIIWKFLLYQVPYLPSNNLLAWMLTGITLVHSSWRAALSWPQDVG